MFFLCVLEGEGLLALTVGIVVGALLCVGDEVEFGQVGCEVDLLEVTGFKRCY